MLAAAVTVTAAVGLVVPSAGAAATPVPPVLATPAPPPAGAVPDTIPADFPLPAPSGSGAPAVAVDDLGTGVCGDRVPGLAAATDRRVVEQTGPESVDRLGLLVFADADAAVAFVDGVWSEAASCAPAEPPAPGRAVVTAPLAGPWGQGLALRLVDVAAGATTQSAGATLLLTRRGSAVAVRYAAGGSAVPPFTVDPGVVAAVRPPLDELAPRLCLWTVAGCSAPSPGPGPGEPAVPAGVRALVPDHNDVTAPRINLVFAAQDAPPGVDWVSAARRMLTWDGPAPQTSVVDPTGPAFGLEWGPFAIDPLRSRKDLFNVWYLDRPPGDAAGAGGPGGSDRSGLPDDLQVTLVFGEQTPGAPYGLGEYPQFVPPALPAPDSDPFGRVTLNVGTGTALTGSGAPFAEILSHELGHTLFGLPDRYAFERGIEGPPSGSAYPSCAADQAQAEEFFGDLVGVVDPFLDDYLAAYQRYGIPKAPEEVAALRDAIRIDFVPDGCFGPAGIAKRSSQNTLMTARLVTVYDAAERRWADRVLDAWAGR